jgi:hypothetical protein
MNLTVFLPLHIEKFIELKTTSIEWWLSSPIPWWHVQLRLHSRPKYVLWLMFQFPILFFNKKKTAAKLRHYYPSINLIPTSHAATTKSKCGTFVDYGCKLPIHIFQLHIYLPTIKLNVIFVGIRLDVSHRKSIHGGSYLWLNNWKMHILCHGLCVTTHIYVCTLRYWSP